jgi:uncharacterized protein YndB with AHSA1/START domain
LKDAFTGFGYAKNPFERQGGGLRVTRRSGKGPSVSLIGCCRKALAMTANKPYAEVRQRFTVAPEKVFAAFAEAGLVGRWLRPSPQIGLTVLQFDFRQGGAYRFAYHVPGGPTMIVGGSYALIEPPSKIVFSWIIEPPDEHAGIESEVTVTITPQGGGSELFIRHEKFVRPDAIQRHAEGWRGAVDQLTAILEREGQHGR